MGRIKLEKLNNTRDLGGLAASSGKKIKEGKLIRSGHLFTASKNDIITINGMIDTVIDFRADREVFEKPDPDMEGVKFHHLPVLNDKEAGVTRDSESDEYAIENLIRDEMRSLKHMTKIYEGFAEEYESLDTYERFLRILMEDHEKAVLWHCTAGKDRAGFASLLIEEILGVDRRVIIEDYLITNKYLEPEIEALFEMLTVKAKPGREGNEKAMRLLFGAQKSYLDNLYSKIDDIYGSFMDFVRKGLNIKENEVERLKELYLEP